MLKFGRAKVWTLSPSLREPCRASEAWWLCFGRRLHASPERIVSVAEANCALNDSGDMMRLRSLFVRLAVSVPSAMGSVDWIVGYRFFLQRSVVLAPR